MELNRFDMEMYREREREIRLNKGYSCGDLFKENLRQDCV